VQRVRAVVIVHGGQIVYERYSPNPADHASAMMSSYSIAKSFTSALVGILVRDGRWTSSSRQRCPSGPHPAIRGARLRWTICCE
jgi:hypothetical protein